MLAFTAALLGAVLVPLLPPLLVRGDWRWHKPRTAMLVWASLFVGGLTLLFGGLVALVLAAVTHSTHGAIEATSLAVAGWVGLALAGALAALVFTRAEPVVGAARRAEWLTQVLAARSQQRFDVAGTELVVVDHPDAVAFGCGGSTAGQVVLSSDLCDRLGPGGVRAVVEHERAHARQRHQLMLQLAAVNRACFPWLSGARGLDRDVRVLSELAADDAAGDVCGASAVAGALRVMEHASGFPGLSSRANRLEQIAARPTRPGGEPHRGSRVWRAAAASAGRRWPFRR